MPNVSMRYGKAGKFSGGANASEEQTSLFTLLWTNASPTSNFAAQTVTLDLSEYSFVLVLFRHSTSADVTATLSGMTNVGGSARLLTGSAETNRIGIRTARAETDGVVFSSCTFNNATNNGIIIPYQIWGVK